MYTVERPDTSIYCLGQFNYFRQGYTIKKIGNSEKALVAFLANGFRKDDFWGTFSNPRMDWKYWDGMNRVIDPHTYYRDAHLYWVRYLKNKPKEDWRVREAQYKKNKTYKGEFRKTPVEGIRKHRGGPHVRPRKLRHIAAMYDNPEFKDFNRGSKDDFPEGWYDDFYRCDERNWKSQRRHQWKDK